MFNKPFYIKMQNFMLSAKFQIESTHFQEKHYKLKLFGLFNYYNE